MAGENIERSSTGWLGAFPLRIAVGKVLAVCAALLLTPVWWALNEARSPFLEKFYERTYWASLRDGFQVAPGGEPVAAQYEVALENTPTGLALASVEDAEEFQNKLIIQKQSVNPKLFHAWLHDHVYHGSALNRYGFLVAFETVSFLGFCSSARTWIDAGVCLRWTAHIGAVRGLWGGGGSIGSSSGRCGACGCFSLTNVWLLRRCKPLSGEVGGGRLHPFVIGLLAAGWRKHCAVFGVRWPGAEGPGLALEIGLIARALISEELLPYHLNLFGGTGRGK